MKMMFKKYKFDRLIQHSQRAIIIVKCELNETAFLLKIDGIFSDSIDRMSGHFEEQIRAEI